MSFPARLVLAHHTLALARSLSTAAPCRRALPLLARPGPSLLRAGLPPLAAPSRTFFTSPVACARSKDKKAKKAAKKAAKAQANQPKKKKKVVVKKKRSSKKESLNASEKLPLEEALAVLRAVEITRPNSMFELTIKTELDRSSGGVTVPKGRISLPREPKERKKDTIMVFADGKKAEDARKVGADFVGGTEMIDELISGRLRPNVILCTPDLIRAITPRLGRFLGPKGLMPSPRRGTVTDDIRGFISRTQGSNEWKADKDGTIRAPIGRVDYPTQDLVKNFRAYITAVIRATTKRGQNQAVSDKSAFNRMLAKRSGKDKIKTAVVKVILSSSHGPGIVVSDAVQ
ncbi:ribosomal protein L1 [Auricularia subglabra TFB-10046 SS5]|nr:ribosomal protein L1 [Auricularia subglabra TFB-10046 SS5]